jgi:hypothetical protein
LRQIKDIEAWYIEGCSYRNNITVSLVRQPYEAISVDPLLITDGIAADFLLNSTFNVNLSLLSIFNVPTALKFDLFCRGD